MFVARFSYNPQYDAERRWTAYMEPTARSKEALAEALIELGMVKLPRRLDKSYWEGDTEAAIDYVVETQDIRYHELAGLWMLVHNQNGLSCWPLSSETLEGAIEEARRMDEEGELEWGSFGWVTKGNVRYVASVTSVLHIFECDDVRKESEFSY